MSLWHQNERKAKNKIEEVNHELKREVVLMRDVEDRLKKENGDAVVGDGGKWNDRRCKSSYTSGSKVPAGEGIIGFKTADRTVNVKSSGRWALDESGGTHYQSFKVEPRKEMEFDAKL